MRRASPPLTIPPQGERYTLGIRAETSSSTIPLPPPPQRGRGLLRRAESQRHEIHPLLAERASRHHGVARPDRRQAHHDRARGRGRRGQGEALEPSSSPLSSPPSSIPNADRLRVCMVDIGEVAKAIRCRSCAGRRMRVTGMKGVFVPPGTYIPGKHMTLMSAPSAASRAAACCARNSNCDSPTTTTASSNCRRMRRSACPLPNIAASPIR